MFILLRMIHCFVEKNVLFFLKFIRKKTLITMGKLVVVGLQELRKPFGTYEQFVSTLWNIFKISDVRNSLWNGTLLVIKTGHLITTVSRCSDLPYGLRPS